MTLGLLHPKLWQFHQHQQQCLYFRRQQMQIFSAITRGNLGLQGKDIEGPWSCTPKAILWIIIQDIQQPKMAQGNSGQKLENMMYLSYQEGGGP